jgi:PAS domain S-box-containing protein
MSHEGRTREQLLVQLEAMRRQIAEVSSVADNSSDYIMRYDRQGRHTYANRAALEVTGLSAAQYIGKTHKEMGFPKHLCELWEANIQEVFETSQPVAVEFEVEIAGGWMNLELKLHPEFDETRRVASVLGVSRDITERKRAERALRASEERLKAQLKGSPIPTYIWRKEQNDFVLAGFNDAADKYTNGRISEWVGSQLSEMYKDDPAILEDFWRCYSRPCSG